MPTKWNFKRLILALACGGMLAACSDDDKADVEQRLNEERHDAQECPQIADGQYRLANSAANVPQVVAISHNQGAELVFSFDGRAAIIANGNEQTFADGSRYTVACVGSTARIAGINERGEQVSMQMYGTEQGLALNLDQPSDVTGQYQKALAAAR